MTRVERVLLYFLLFCFVETERKVVLVRMLRWRELNAFKLRTHAVNESFKNRSVIKSPISLLKSLEICEEADLRSRLHLPPLVHVLDVLVFAMEIILSYCTWRDAASMISVNVELSSRSHELLKCRQSAPG